MIEKDDGGVPPSSPGGNANYPTNPRSKRRDGFAAALI
jgi:hypothetical protein